MAFCPMYFPSQALSLPKKIRFSRCFMKIILPCLNTAYDTSILFNLCPLNTEYASKMPHESQEEQLKQLSRQLI